VLLQKPKAEFLSAYKIRCPRRTYRIHEHGRRWFKTAVFTASFEFRFALIVVCNGRTVIAIL